MMSEHHFPKKLSADRLDAQGSHHQILQSAPLEVFYAPLRMGLRMQLGRGGSQRRAVSHSVNTQ